MIRNKNHNDCLKLEAVLRFQTVGVENGQQTSFWPKVLHIASVAYCQHRVYIGFSTTFYFWFLRHLKLRRYCIAFLIKKNTRSILSVLVFQFRVSWFLANQKPSFFRKFEIFGQCFLIFEKCWTKCTFPFFHKYHRCPLLKTEVNESKILMPLSRKLFWQKSLSQNLYSSSVLKWVHANLKIREVKFQVCRMSNLEYHQFEKNSKFSRFDDFWPLNLNIIT